MDGRTAMHASNRLSACLAALGLSLVAFVSPISALEEGCPGIVAQRRLLITPAALERGEVRLTFVGHATFLIESPGGIKVATDYNDYVRPDVTPDIVTMNRAHSTHHS